MHSARASTRAIRSHLLQRPHLQRTLFTRATPASKLSTYAWTLTGVVIGGAFLIYAHDSKAAVHRFVAMPILHTLTDPEESHKIAIKVLSSGLAPVDKGTDDDALLGFDLWGKHFANPIGMAAGFDKHAEAIDGLFDLGFGYVEVGSVTPEPQDGNPKPRFFRLPSSESVINRYGFNSDGHFAIIDRLRRRVEAMVESCAHYIPSNVYLPPALHTVEVVDPVTRLLNSEQGAQAKIPDVLGMNRSLHPNKILAINLGKNKRSDPDSVDDFVNGVKNLGPYADVLVVNISSPNTPGLRTLQRKGMLEELLSQVVKARDGLQGSYKPPVLVKIAPDVSTLELQDIGSAALETKIDGIIVSNTTISRPAGAATEAALAEVGGLSGPPLKPIALSTLSKLYRITNASIPLIGCGGIKDGQDVIDYAKAGASFVQLYTQLGYYGVGLPRKLKDEVTEILKAEGTTWRQIVGSGLSKEALKWTLVVDPSDIVIPAPFKGEAQTIRQELENLLSIVEDSSRHRTPTTAATSSTIDPQVSAQSTLPSAVQSSSPPASGFTPEGTERIIILQNQPPLPDSTLQKVTSEVKHVKDVVVEKAQHAGHVIVDAITHKSGAPLSTDELATTSHVDEIARRLKKPSNKNLSTAELASTEHVEELSPPSAPSKPRSVSASELASTARVEDPLKATRSPSIFEAVVKGAEAAQNPPPGTVEEVKKALRSRQYTKDDVYDKTKPRLV